MSTRYVWEKCEILETVSMSDETEDVLALGTRDGMYQGAPPYQLL